jgi:Dolichyl-phosphate-mannose-protein mannosyltransferase
MIRALRRLARSISLTWWLLAGIVALAAATRFAAIGSHLSIDDAYSWFAASSPNANVFLDRLADNENTPPLIYLVVMAMPGSSPAWLRVPAAIPGVLICVALFLALRPRLGDGPSLLAALGVAVAPYLITYSNVARGFMLSDLALIVALWCLLSLAERETRGKWVGFFLAGTVAVYSEYRSAIVLIAMAAAAVWLGRPRRRSTLIACGAVLLALAAWIPEIVRGQDQVGVTKFNPLSAKPSVTGLRDAFVTLALGENGGTGSSAGRWLLFVGIVALCGVAYLVLRRSWTTFDEPARRTIQVLAVTSVLTLLGYALAGVVGIDIFSQRYLTILVPFAAALAAMTLAALPVRWVVPATAVLLVGLGLGNFERRLGGQWQPDLAPVRVAAAGLHPRTVLTNTPVVLYYLRSFEPDFDRPYNLGRGRAATCARPCLVIDDTRVHGGTPRGATGELSQIGPFLFVYER